MSNDKKSISDEDTQPKQNPDPSPSSSYIGYPNDSKIFKFSWLNDNYDLGIVNRKIGDAGWSNSNSFGFSYKKHLPDYNISGNVSLNYNIYNDYGTATNPTHYVREVGKNRDIFAGLTSLQDIRPHTTVIDLTPSFQIEEKLNKNGLSHKFTLQGDVGVYGSQFGFNIQNDYHKLIDAYEIQHDEFKTPQGLVLGVNVGDSITYEKELSNNNLTISTNAGFSLSNVYKGSVVGGRISFGNIEPNKDIKFHPEKDYVNDFRHDSNGGGFLVSLGVNYNNTMSSKFFEDRKLINVMQQNPTTVSYNGDLGEQTIVEESYVSHYVQPKFRKNNLSVDLEFAAKLGKSLLLSAHVEVTTNPAEPSDIYRVTDFIPTEEGLIEGFKRSSVETKLSQGEHFADDKYLLEPINPSGDIGKIRANVGVKIQYNF